MNDISSIPVISVSYNSVELIEELLRSFRAHYDNYFIIIDGSDDQHYRDIERKCSEYSNVRFIHFDFNIHHGPGMAWAFKNLGLRGPVLVLDSDISVVRHGFLEQMHGELTENLYGVGYVNQVNEGGFDVSTPQDDAISYLHPACMLVNMEVVLAWPMPTKHGAPMIEPMMAMHRAGRSDLIVGLDWIREDFGADPLSTFRHYLRHDWQGTVKNSGSYNLEEWLKVARESADIRQSLLNLIPTGLGKIVELGASDGLLRRAYREINPNRPYVSVGCDPMSGSTAVDDIDRLDEAFFQEHSTVECWILLQVLEKIADPERLINSLHQHIQSNACVIAVVPNAQHWSLQLRLITGDLTYSDSGLLSQGQRRWFSRSTLLNLFQDAGFVVTEGLPVVHNPLHNQEVENAMRQISSTLKANPDISFKDSQADMYIIKAVPRQLVPTKH